MSNINYIYIDIYWTVNIPRQTFIPAGRPPHLAHGQSRTEGMTSRRAIPELAPSTSQACRGFEAGRLTCR